MNCKKIRELVMTDYIDAELGEDLAKKVQSHLNLCEKCRALEESLRKTGLEPFKDLDQARPPDYVWERIKENMEKDRAKEYVFPVFTGRRHVFAALTAVAACVIILVITGAYLNSEKQINSFFQEQADFLGSLEKDAASPLNGTFSEISLSNIVE